MAKIDVSINSRNYAVMCNDGEEQRVRQLAGILDRHIKQISHGSNANDAQLLLLVAMMMADQIYDDNGEIKLTGMISNNNAPADETILLAAVQHLTERVEKLAADIGRA